MNIPCPTAITCPGSDFPILNFSSEGPDIFHYASPVPDPPPCQGLSCNPQEYYSRDCAGTVFSASSQAEADRLARLSLANCIDNPFGCVNDPQTAVAYCADGTSVSYTTPAGQFAGPNTGTLEACIAAANAQALAYAEQQVALLPPLQCSTSSVTTCSISTPSPLSNGQVGTAYSQNIVGSIPGFLTVFSLQGGSLPPGLSMDAQGHITGTPTLAGTYSFTVKLATAPTLTPEVSMSSEAVIVTDPVFGTIISNDMQFTFQCSGLTVGQIYLITYTYRPPGGGTVSTVTQWFLAISVNQTVKSPLFPKDTTYAAGSDPAIAVGAIPIPPTPAVSTGASPFGGGWLRFTSTNLSIGDTYDLSVVCTHGSFSRSFVATDTTVVRDEFVSPCSGSPVATISVAAQAPPTPHVDMNDTVPPSNDKDFLCTQIIPGYQYRISVTSSLTGAVDLTTFTAAATSETQTLSVLGLGTVSNPSIVYVP